MTDKEYFELDRMSSHKLMDFKRSPEFYYKRHVTKEIVQGDTRSMGLGRLFHLAILEPNRFQSEIFVRPQADLRTKLGKELIENFTKSLPEYAQMVDQESYKSAISMKESFAKRVSVFKETGEFEKVVLFEMEGVECKSKFDYIDDEYIIDVKTTVSVADNDFKWSSKKYGYDLQAAFYYNAALKMDGIYRKYYIVAIETEAPHLMKIFEITPEMIEHRTNEIKSLLNSYKEKIRSGSFEDQVVVKPMPISPYYFEGDQYDQYL